MRFDRKAFTLIELIIVIVIIGILASVAAPMIGNMKVKTICAEGVTAMGTIRAALRAYHAEHNAYPEVYGWLKDIDREVFPKYFPGIAAVEELRGTYFDKKCYYIVSLPGFFKIICTVRTDEEYDAPKAAEAVQIIDPGENEGSLEMDKNGRIKQDYISRSGYPPLP